MSELAGYKHVGDDLKVPATFLLLALLSVGLMASVPPVFGATYSQCLQTGRGVTSTLLDCDKTEGDQLDAELNDSYKKLMTALPEVRKPLLRQAQRDWLVFRHDECSFRGSAEASGSDAPLVADSCALELTRIRIGALRQALVGAQP